MCEIIPEVPHCCFLVSLRLGILFISVFAMMSGAVGLSAMEQKKGINFKQSYANMTKLPFYTGPREVISNLGSLTDNTIVSISIIFMISGMILFFACLSDQEGFAQVFVWLIFICIIWGYVCMASIGLECFLKSTCLLSNMDWPSASAAMVMMIFYLLLWFYFITVANSYVLNG